jgi:hypothetical protein
MNRFAVDVIDGAGDLDARLGHSPSVPTHVCRVGESSTLGAKK